MSGVIKINTLYQTHPKGLFPQYLLPKFQIIANWSKKKCIPIPIYLAWLKAKNENEEGLQANSVIILSPSWLTVIQVGWETNYEQASPGRRSLS